MIEIDGPNVNGDSEFDTLDNLAVPNVQKMHGLVDLEPGMWLSSESVAVMVFIDSVILIVKIICVFNLSQTGATIILGAPATLLITEVLTRSRSKQACTTTSLVSRPIIRPLLISLTNMLSILHTSAHFWGIVRSRKFILRPGYWTTTGVEDLWALAKSKDILVALFLPLGGKMDAPALQNCSWTFEQDSLSPVSL